jgi:hypothetical protein
VTVLNTNILISTFVLTLLLMVGLFFFIKGSTKDRLEQIELTTIDPVEALLEKLQAHLQARAYNLIKVEPEQRKLTFQGHVRPSWFMAIFLSLLATVGLSCMGLVLAQLNFGNNLNVLFLSLLSPLAGLFYWRGSDRMENVVISVDTSQSIKIVGHRDELNLLEKTIS